MHRASHGTKFFFTFIWTWILPVFPITCRVWTRTWTLPLFPLTCQVWAFNILFLMTRIFFIDSSVLFPGTLFLSEIRFPLLRMFAWVWTRILHSFPNACTNAALFNFSNDDKNRLISRHQRNSFCLCYYQIPEPGLRHWWKTFFWRCFKPSFQQSTLHALLSISKKMGAGKHRQIHDVPQMEKVILFIACITSFRQNVCKLSKLIMSNNQSLATLWVLHTRLIVGLLPWLSF